MNQLQRRLLFSARRLSFPIIPSVCLLHRRLFSTSHSDSSPASFPSSHNKIQMPEERASSKSRSTSSTTSLSEEELAKFSAVADTWWHSEGPFKPLHQMNPTRLAFIRSILCRHFSKDLHSARPFEGLRLIDIGCGGGLLTEPLARMGATVTGVDAVDKNIKIARLHADMDPVSSTIEYLCTTAEMLVDEGRNASCCSFLGANPAEFCKSLSALTIPNGATIISTVNRNMRAFASTIVAAEYILRWLPKGTHQYSSFVTSEELAMILQRASVDVKGMAGFVYNPITGRWLLSDDISVNYIAYGTTRESS